MNEAMNELARDYAFLTVLLFVVFFLLGLFAAFARSEDIPVERKALLTKRELEAFRNLCSLFPNHHIAPQVAMGAIVQTERSLASARKTSVRNTFDRKIVDFVVLHPQTGKIEFLIEIDDWSHNASKDARRDAITKAAGYRTIRHPAGAKVDRISLEATIRQALAPTA